MGDFYDDVIRRRAQKQQEFTRSLDADDQNGGGDVHPAKRKRLENGVEITELDIKVTK